MPHKFEMIGTKVREITDPALVAKVDQDFDNELMCSQVTFRYGARKLGFDENMALLAASGFGWGMQHGERCGAVTGSLMALGLKYGYRTLEEFPNYDILKEKQAEFDRRFKEHFGSVMCGEILKANYGIPKERETIYEEERYRGCSVLTAYACQLLEELLSDSPGSGAGDGQANCKG